MENQKLELVQEPESYKIVVTEEAEKKIRFLCDRLPHNEWSGTLFYTVEGSFEDDNLCIYAKDFYLQDVGEGTFTEFQNDVTLASYMVEHDLLDCYTGLIHSHNTMSAFFSGTDQSTLQSEGTDTNHFVSLIINNAGKYCAAITRKVSRKLIGTEAQVYNTFNNIPVIRDGKEFEVEDTIIEYFKLEVTIEHPVIEKDELEMRLEELKNSNKSYINRGKAVLESAKTAFPSTPTTYMPTVKAESVPSYKQLTLFDDFEDPTVEEFPTLTKDLINSQFKQLISGSIFSEFNPNLDIDKWVINMEKVYKKKFPGKVGRELFEYYADAMVEFLSEEAIGGADLEVCDLFLDEWARAMIERLKKASCKNEYIDYYIKSLERWKLY